MVDLSISKGQQGITYALAEYAKELNGGNPVKFDKEKWQNIMKAVAEINSKRPEDNTIFTGGSDFQGRADKNFIVRGDKVTFTDEEMGVILREMGLRPKENKTLPQLDSPMKGLSIERNPKDLILEEKISYVSPVLPETPKRRIKFPFFNKSAESQPAQNSAQLTSNEIETVQKTSDVQPTALQPIKDSELVKKEVEDFSYPHINLYNKDGQLVRSDYKVDILNWNNSKGPKYSVAYHLASERVEKVLVKNDKDAVIANAKIDKFYIGSQEVNLKKFEKHSAKYGETLSIEYKKREAFKEVPPKLAVLDVKKAKIEETFDRSTIKTTPLEEPPFLKPRSFRGKVYLTKSEMVKIVDIARKLRCDRNDLIAIMNSESGVTPDATNFKKKNGKKTDEIQAYGVIQFTQVAIDDINEVHKENLSFEKLKKMPLIEQLDYAEKYLLTAKKRVFGDKKLSGGELYALVYLPGVANQQVLARQGHKHYEQNSRLDYRENGVITKDDLDETIKAMRVSVHVSKD